MTAMAASKPAAVPHLRSAFIMVSPALPGAALIVRLNVTAVIWCIREDGGHPNFDRTYAARCNLAIALNLLFWKLINARRDNHSPARPSNRQDGGWSKS